MLLLLVVSVSLAGLGQTTVTGALHGQLTDPSGAIIPGATVQLFVSGQPGAKPYTVQTGSDGTYRFPALPPGTYSLSATVQGFTPFAESGIVIVSGTSRSLNVPLSIATQEQQVQVTADTAGVDISPENNASSVVITGKDLDALSDDPDELQNELNALAGPAAGSGGGQIYIDGFTGGQLPPKSAIREIRINQNPFSAEFDKLGYGRIEILTKPGTDKVHGQVEASGNSSAFNTNNPFLKTEPSYYSYFLNGSVGGSFSKKTSWFVSSFARKVQNVNVVNAFLPSGTQPPDTSDGTSTNFTEGVLNPSSRVSVRPRLDYQLTPTNTLTLGYQWNRESATAEGVGQLNLASQGYDTRNTENVIQVSDSQVFGPHLVNDTRFQYRRNLDSQVAENLTPTVSVQGFFTGGGSNSGVVHTTSNFYELQNYSTGSYGAHALRFGVRLRANQVTDQSTSGSNGYYIFSGLQNYQNNQPKQYTVTRIANAFARSTLFDAGLFFQDDWKVRPNFTLSYGLRFESQNRIRDHADWGPRVEISYALGPANGKKPAKTVLRAGYGWFFERFNNDYVLTAIHQNGLNQTQYVFQNPTFYPNGPTDADFAHASQSAPTTYSLGPRLRAALDMQAAIGVDRTISKAVTANVTYLYSRGVHQYLSDNINAPLPGQYDPVTGQILSRPLGGNNNIYQFQSGGVYNQQQLIATINARAKRVTLFGFYTLNFAKSDTQGPTYFPSLQTNPGFDYGRASFDVRNRLVLGGNTLLPYQFSLSPFLVANSGAPYNITIGDDLNGDNQFNDRPSFARPGDPYAIQTQYGLLNPLPAAGEARIPYGFGNGPANFSMNLRVGKTFGIGPKVEKGGHGPGGGGGGGGGPRGPRGGLGPGGLSGGGNNGPGPLDSHVPRKYNLTFVAFGRNIFNIVNLAEPNPVLASGSVADGFRPNNTFNQSLALAGGFFSRSSANRSIDLQVNFNF